MPITPVEAREQLRKRSADLSNICGVHRMIWRIAQALPPCKREEIEGLLVVAYIMGKKMDRRLRKHYGDSQGSY